MAMAMATIVLVVRVDEDGDYCVEVGGDAIGAVSEEQAVRRVEVTIHVPIPSPLVVAVTVPAEAGEAAVRVG